jgi:hypothetical protein
MPKGTIVETWAEWMNVDLNAFKKNPNMLLA